jgi:polar amino acid transport system substrate-binding protein
MKSPLLIVLLLFSSKLFAYTLNIVTELFPTYQYLDSDGKLVGPTVSKVERVLSDSNIEYNLIVQPWHIAYNAVLRDDNMCIFSIGRSSEREDMFSWLFPVAKFSSSFYALKSRKIKLNVLEDALKYRTAVIRNNFSHQYLKENDFTEQSQLVVISSFKKVFDILKTRKNQLDLVVLGDAQVKDASKNNALMAELEPVSPIKNINNTLYFACNKSVPESVTEKIKRTFKILS